MKRLFNILKRIYPVILGAIGGYLYYYFIGCTTGACPITRNPYISIVYGALIGSVFAFNKPKKEEKKDVIRDK